MLRRTEGEERILQLLHVLQTSTSGSCSKPLRYEFDFTIRYANNYAMVQGRANPTFSKPCLCLSDTRHFRHFRRFRGSEEQSPCFEWKECKFVIFTVFVKTPLFGRGHKHGSPKTRFVPPRMVRKMTLWSSSLSFFPLFWSCLKEQQTQKNPRVRKILVRNSGAGNGCANFMGA